MKNIILIKFIILSSTVFLNSTSLAESVKKNKDSENMQLIKKIIESKTIDLKNISFEKTTSDWQESCGNAEDDGKLPRHINFDFEIKSKMELNNILIPVGTNVFICNDKVTHLGNSNPNPELTYLDYKCRSIFLEENEKNMCSCTLSETTRVNEIDYEAGSTIYFKNNKPIGAAFIDSEYMTKLGLKRGSFRFDDKGRPTIEDEKGLFCWYTPKDKPVTLETYKKSKK